MHMFPAPSAALKTLDRIAFFKAWRTEARLQVNGQIVVPTLRACSTMWTLTREGFNFPMVLSESDGVANFVVA